MLILALESSAKAASAALCRDGELIAQNYQRSGLTHSRTLLPMAEDILRCTDTPKDTIDVIAVAHGPGSFTGIRIGVAAAKGLCWGLDRPAVGVSTLEAMAFSAAGTGDDYVISPVMDARRSQLYNALFEVRDGRVQRLCPDRAVAAQDLAEELAGLGRNILILGDGWRIGSEALAARGVPHTVAPEYLRYQTAFGVALAAMDKTPAGAEDLLPVYLRLSQAERERQERMQNQQNI